MTTEQMQKFIQKAEREDREASSDPGDPSDPALPNRTGQPCPASHRALRSRDEGRMPLERPRGIPALRLGEAGVSRRVIGLPMTMIGIR